MDDIDSLRLALMAEKHVHRKDNEYLLERAELAEARLARAEEAIRLDDELEMERNTLRARLRELEQLSKNARALAASPDFDREAMRNVLRAILDAALAGEKS